MNKFEFKNLTPFKWFVLENFPFIEADFDALTEWQLFCKIGKEINKIIDSQNIVGEQAENLTNAFNNLKNYVDNYFENLDVQEEINNKLNGMAEDGTLQEIISSYLNSKAIFGFNTVSDMKTATNLINGSYAKTLGFHSKNDGGGATYLIRTVTNEDNVDNMFILPLQNQSLVAELIVEDILDFKKIGSDSSGTNSNDDYLISAIRYLKNKTIQNDITSYSQPTLLIPNGIYKFTNEIILTDVESIKITGENSILDNLLLTFSNSGHEININNLIFKKGGIKINVSDRDRSQIFIEKCHFTDTDTAIYCNNQSAMVSIEKCKFMRCKKILNNISCDNILINNCWFADYQYTVDGDVSIIHTKGNMKILNTFFIPNGIGKLPDNCAWVEMNGTSNCYLTIDKCRISNEPGYKGLINYKCSASREPGYYGISLLNNFLWGRYGIQLYSYCPNIKILNNNIKNANILKVNNSYTIPSLISANIYYIQNSIIFKNNTSDSNIYDTIPDVLIDLVDSDYPVYKKGTNSISKYIGYYSATLGSFRTLHYNTVIQFTKSVAPVGVCNIIGLLDIYTYNSEIKAKFTTLSNDLDINITPVITFNYTGSDGVPHENQEYVPADNNYYSISINISLSEIRYSEIRANTVLIK